jgi:hypothetical protein
MKAVRLISLIARMALMVTMGLGLVFWIAQLFVWSGLLVLLAQSGTEVHSPPVVLASAQMIDKSEIPDL